MALPSIGNAASNVALVGSVSAVAVTLGVIDGEGTVVAEGMGGAMVGDSAGVGRVVADGRGATVVGAAAGGKAQLLRCITIGQSQRKLHTLIAILYYCGILEATLVARVDAPTLHLQQPWL